MKRQRDLTLFLAGDVMTGRGIDQCLPRSTDPLLFEPYVKNAGDYVILAERQSGAISRPLTFTRLWGDALEELNQRRPDVRIINLETAATTANEPWPEKGIHYRMHPDNAALLATAGVDICVLANNHTMDWGRDGLTETIQAVRNQNVTVAGAGPDAASAATPARIDTGSGRLLVFAYTCPCAGTPLSWTPGASTPGVNLLNAPDQAGIARVIREVRAIRCPDDRVIVSIHWGGNWGYDIPVIQQTFARRLIDAGAADIIYGHSSHHPKSMEIYRDRLILYGCGDLINDYEGIGGREEYSEDLPLMYFPRLDAGGALVSLEITPMKIHRFSLCYPPKEAVATLTDRLNHDPNLHTRIQFGVQPRWIQDHIPEEDRHGDRSCLRLVREP
ncbi:MAG: CapA family protein [Bacteroidota bacterium]